MSVFDASRDLAGVRNRKPQVRIGRQRDGRKAFVVQKLDRDAEAFAASASDVSVRTTPLT